MRVRVLDGNLCMGSWEQIDRWHFYRNHYGCLYSNGMVIGYFNETETDVLAPDGNSYTGAILRPSIRWMAA
jgi:hypothetical protein